MPEKTAASDARSRLRRALDMLAALPSQEAERMLATLPAKQREAVLAARATAVKKPAEKAQSVNSKPTPDVRTPVIPPAYLPDKQQVNAKKTNRNATPSHLQALPVDALAACLARESAEVVALVLRSLDPQRAQEIARQLPDELGSRAVVAMARMSNPAPGVLYCISQTLQEDVQRYLNRQQERKRGIQCMAQTLAVAQREAALEALLELGQRDSELALAVSNELEIILAEKFDTQKPATLVTKTDAGTYTMQKPFSEAAA